MDAIEIRWEIQLPVSKEIAGLIGARVSKNTYARLAVFGSFKTKVSNSIKSFT